MFKRFVAALYHGGGRNGSLPAGPRIRPQWISCADYRISRPQFTA